MLGLVVLIALWVMGAYNGLVRLRNEAKNAWSQIDVQLKRRHDLIPNLVETVKGYMKHEQGTLEKVIHARSAAVGAAGGGVAAQVKAEGELSGVLSRLMVLAEAYPDLKANTNFISLQEELGSTENKISFSRQYYNDSAMKLNNQIEMFPSNVVAGMFRFEKSPFFEVEDAAERKAPQVKF
jgi:LemA protein